MNKLYYSIAMIAAAFTMFSFFIIDNNTTQIEYIDMSDYPVYITPTKGEWYDDKPNWIGKRAVSRNIFSNEIWINNELL